MEDGTVVSKIRLTLELWNIGIVVVSALLLVTLIGYPLLENFTYH
jgi:hypothetical protein